MWAAAALLWIVAVVTPGPNFFVIARLAAANGRLAALGAVAGVAVGTAVWGLAGLFGIRALFALAPGAFVMLKLVGGAYILWLGVKALRGALVGGAEPEVAPGHGFRLGLMTNLANPKSAAFVAALFAATLPPDLSLAAGLTAVAMIVAISAGWYALVALALSRPVVRRGYLSLRRGVDAAAGTIFAAFGLSMIRDAVRP
ncbi:LysE family transporter [Pontivivens ytuae]|uniref:LysE family transporter n=1 Tax=Pontivivens ytuae TaxID=2789856 RepID=A0A7S9QC39_9RHOB|nr:LysE family transporter [Pontivivens ytuae]QPH52987.1 LysE family transporter [Pontivivens ytuae]